MPSVLVGNRDGLLWFDAGGRPGDVAHEGRRVTAIAAERDALWAVVDGSEVWHSADRRTWRAGGSMQSLAGSPESVEGSPESVDGSPDTLRATCIAPTDAGVLVGSSEARLFRVAPSETGREAVEAIEAFDAADGRSTWYTPWGGPPDTRSIAEWDEAVYVNVHVGGILRTTDGGGAWTPTIDIDEDVHQVTTAEGLVLAACAGGVAVSEDGGATWTLRTEGLEARYSRGVVVCGETVLVSASRGPRGGRAAVYRGALAGGGFERCRNGLPEWFDDNIDTHCLDGPPDGSLVAFGTTDGRVFASDDAGLRWNEIATGLSPVDCVLVIP